MFDFDAHAEDFDAHLHQHAFFHNHLIATIAAIIPAVMPDGGSLLEIGAGNGHPLASYRDALILHKVKGVSLTGWEPSLAMIRAAMFSYPEIAASCYRRTGLPVKDRSKRFNVIVCSLTRHFLPPEDQLQAASDLYELLLPGGCLLLVDKCQEDTALSDGILAAAYRNSKINRGATDEEIELKASQLIGHLYESDMEATTRRLADGDGPPRLVFDFFRCLQFHGRGFVKP